MTSGTERVQPAEPTVGNATARAVHGLSAGADVVVLGGDGGSAITQTLALLGISSPPVVLGGPLSAQLGGLADALARTGDAPAVVAAHDLGISPVALLDLLDGPGVRTAALVADPYALAEGADLATPARVGHDGKLVESVGTSAHEVTAPNRALPGVLRVSGPDRAEAARLLRAAASSADGWGSDAVAVATLVLVRGGLTVQAGPLGPFDWSRPGVRAVGAAGEPWRQRLRGASRGGDGFFSTYAVRPLSRRLTGVGLAHGWTPNVVTVVSLAFGLVAALLVATGAWWAWVVAAVLLLVALVVDCVDGEIARFTRRFSPLGAFLDAVGDRVKEYAVLAAVAAVAVRQGSDGWPVALAAMAVVTLRHLEDYAYEHRLRGSRRSRPDLLPVDVPRDLGPQGARTTFAPPPSTRTQVVHWTKKVVHMPIAERYLLISLTLLTHRPMLVLWVLTVAVAVAVAWTQGGRVAAVLAGRDRTWASVEQATGRGDLDEQLDLGPLAVAVSRALRAPFLVGLLGAAVLVVAVPWVVWSGHVGVGLVVAVVGFVAVAAAWQPPVHHRLAWQAPAALWVAEALTVGVLVHHTLDSWSAAAFAYVAAIAYHRYDVVYRLRDTGTPPASWVAVAGLGTDGRLVVLLLVALLAPGAVVPLLWVSAVALAVVYLTESFLGWRRWIAAQPDPLRTGSPA
ncbi:DUF5941 domain-containing protein [Pedococcus soli]